jgi:acyl dehydratase
MVDRSAVGRVLPSVKARVEPGRLRYFLKTIGECNPIYHDPEAARKEGYSGLAVPPTYSFCLEMLDADQPFAILTALDIDLGRVLHGEQGFAYYAPMLVDDFLTFQPEVTDIADKKGGALTMVAIRTKVTNQRGVHVADLTRTIVVRN